MSADGMLRTSALVASVASFLSLLNILRLPGPESYSGIAGIVTAVLMGGVMPTFYFALYCSSAPICVSRRWSRISLAAAIATGALFVVGFLPRGDVWLDMGGSIVSRLFHLSYLTVVPVLIALYRQPQEGTDRVSQPRFLRVTTRVALTVQGVQFVAFLLGGPILYPAFKTAASASGLPVLTFGSALEIYCVSLLDQASVLTVLYIVKSSGEQRQTLR